MVRVDIGTCHVPQLRSVSPLSQPQAVVSGGHPRDNNHMIRAVINVGACPTKVRLRYVSPSLVVATTPNLPQLSYA